MKAVKINSYPKEGKLRFTYKLVGTEAEIKQYVNDCLAGPNGGFDPRQPNGDVLFFSKNRNIPLADVNSAVNKEGNTFYFLDVKEIAEEVDFAESFAGTVVGDKIAGEVAIDIMAQRRALKAEAKRYLGTSVATEVKAEGTADLSK